MNYEKVEDENLKAFKGKQNIVGFMHCATRLRFTLQNEGIAKEEQIKEIQGILGVARSGGQFQIIIGNEVG